MPRAMKRTDLRIEGRILKGMTVLGVMSLLVLVVVDGINWWYVLFSRGDLSSGAGRRSRKEEGRVYILK